MPSPRLKALDGLRGAAAVIVLIHHSLLVVPALAAPYFGLPVQPGAVSWLVYSPLHLAWAGTEAVYLFFVLSGLVLGFAARSRRFSWSAYFPSRIARLYIPVIGAVVLGAIVIAFTPNADAGDSLWVRARPVDYDLGDMLQDATLVGGTSTGITPLWSLQWEVLFSLLLPLYMYVARRVHVGVQLPVMFALSTLGSFTGVAVLTYLPMFGIGIAMARSWEALSARIAAIPRRVAVVAWPIAITVALLLISSDWSARLVMPGELAHPITLPLVLLGVTVIVVAAPHAPGLSALLSSRPLHLLGLVSFSLYLVHEPIVVAIAQWTDHPLMTPFLALPICLLVAAGFWLLVERPAHRFSRRIRRGAEAELQLAA